MKLRTQNIQAMIREKLYFQRKNQLPACNIEISFALYKMYLGKQLANILPTYFERVLKK